LANLDFLNAKRQPCIEVTGPALRTDEDEDDVAEVEDKSNDEEVIEDEEGHEDAAVHHVVWKFANTLKKFLGNNKMVSNTFFFLSGH